MSSSLGHNPKEEKGIKEEQYIPLRNGRKGSMPKLLEQQPTKGVINVIDSNDKLALAFKTKKVLLKAWKSLIIWRMHTLHKEHAKKLS